MRRAAFVAITLVLGLLLLLLWRTGGARGGVRGAAPSAKVEDTGTHEAPDTAPAEAAHGEQQETPPHTDALATGTVTDADGKPLAGLRLLAIPRGHPLFDAKDPVTPPGEDPAVPFAHSDTEGAFAFPGLEANDYLLGVDGDWVLEPPLRFGANAQGLRALAVRGRILIVLASDIATGEPVERFGVHFREPAGLVGHGSGGVCTVRQRVPPPRSPAWRFSDLAGVGFRVEAEGYQAGSGGVLLEKGAGDYRSHIWLARADEPRVTLHVVFDDGTPCADDADVVLENRSEGVRPGARRTTLALGRSDPGWYHVAIPAGTWRLWFNPRPANGFRDEWTADVQLAAGERREVFLRVERGGNLRVTNRGFEGHPWFLAIGTGSQQHSLYVETADYELRHMRPGAYSLGARQTDLLAGAIRWTEVEVTAGSSQELTIE